MTSDIHALAQGQQSDKKESTVHDKVGPEHGEMLAPVVALACSLCDAGFSPAQGFEYLLKADAQELEVAFMSVCHVCFRCRRAACPECWDPVHRLCDQCVAETGLSFRAEAAPLPGALRPVAVARDAPDMETSSPFVCVRHGRWAAASDRGSAGDRQPAGAALMLPVEQGPQAAAVPVFPDPAPRLVALAFASQVGTSEEQVVDVSNRPASKRMFRMFERVLTIILLAALVIIVALVALAETSATANAAIVRLLHVDIRSEVAYILMLVKHIHW